MTEAHTWIDYLMGGVSVLLAIGVMVLFVIQMILHNDEQL